YTTRRAAPAEKIPTRIVARLCGTSSFRVVFDHVTIRATDRAASERFYTTVLAVLGIDETHSGSQFTEWDDFSLTGATAWNPVTTGLHIGFGAPSRERADEFWQVGTDAG